MKHALESAGSPPPRHKEADQVDDFVAKLRISDPPEIADAADEDGDSDDDMPDSERFTADDEMTETSVNLLLSILEGEAEILLYGAASHSEQPMRICLRGRRQCSTRFSLSWSLSPSTVQLRSGLLPERPEW